VRNTTPLAVRIIGWVGLLGHLATLPSYAASGLLAPGWAVAALLVAWAALLAAAVVLLRRRPVLTPLVPLAAIALWWGALTAGEALLGWSG
jgi:hypothetical protein